jgi:hypothetical protein
VCTAKNRQFLLAKGQGALLQSRAVPALDKENLFVCMAKENITSEEILYRSTVLANKGGLDVRERFNNKENLSRKTCSIVSTEYWAFN